MPFIEINGIEIDLPERMARPGMLEKLRSGEYEADEAAMASRVVRPGFRVLELGAGLGYVTALAAQRTLPHNVLSVEANPALIPVIEDTLARNNCTGVELFNAAVVGKAEPDERVRFSVAHNVTASSLDSENGEEITVPAVGFHDLLRAHRPHIVLMDVEGAEAHFFDEPWKCPLRYCAMELHPKKYWPRAIKRIFMAMARMNMVYDPVGSRGKIVGFRKIGGDEVGATS